MLKWQENNKQCNCSTLPLWERDSRLRHRKEGFGCSSDDSLSYTEGTESPGNQAS